MIWRADLTMGCDFFNKPWLEFTGRQLEQELGTGWAEGVHPDDRDRCMATYAEAFAARREFSMDYRLRRHDGAWRWLLDKGRPFQVAGSSPATSAPASTTPKRGRRWRTTGRRWRSGRTCSPNCTTG